jgi:hypothetical protein
LHTHNNRDKGHEYRQEAACSTEGHNPVQRIYLAQVLYYMAITEKEEEAKYL